MSATETCDICFARDRETLIRPAVERRIKELVREAIVDILKLRGAGLSGDDSGLKDVFEEWADQIASQHSIFFDTYDGLVWSVCAELVSKLGGAEIAVLAAYRDAVARRLRCPECGDQPALSRALRIQRELR